MTSSDFCFKVTLPDGREHVLYTPTAKQLVAHQIQTPNLCILGNRGSGKSIFLRMDAHMRALSIPGCNLALIRKTFPELQKNHGIYMHEEMKLLGGTYHATDHIAYYPNGSRLFLSYVGSETDTMNLLGAEFLGAYFDELSVIPWEFFMKLAASVRTTVGDRVAVLRAATNKLGISAREIKQYFVDKDVDLIETSDYNPDDWGYYEMNMEDNPHLDVKQYRKRFAGMPEHIRKAWLENEWADEFALFSFHPQKRTLGGDMAPYHVIPELDPKIIKYAQIYRAFDMGWFPDPAYCLWIAHLGNRYVAFHEQVWYKTPVEQIAKDIKEKELELRGTVQHPGPLFGKMIATTFCDPTMDINRDDIYTTKDKFEMHGVPMEISVNNREMFATAIHSALSEEPYPGTPKFQAYDQGCPYLIRTIPMMQFDPKKPHNLANHKDDHAAVSLAYFLISIASLGNPGDGGAFQPERPWMKTKQSRWILGNESVR